LFIAGVDANDSILSDRGNDDLVESIERLKQQNTECAGPKGEWKDCEFARGNSLVVLTKDIEGRFTVMKTARDSKLRESILREINILKTMNHPLVVSIRDRCSGAKKIIPAVVTDFVANGSLADHLPDAKNADPCQLNNSTRIMRIIPGIVLAMRSIHSRGIIHRDLTPDNILLGFDWHVKISTFRHSVSANQTSHRALADPGGVASPPDVISRYAARDAYTDVVVLECSMATIAQFGDPG
jgi:serine/threonine protein kinase